MITTKTINKIWPSYWDNKSSIKLDQSYFETSVSGLKFLDEEWINKLLQTFNTEGKIKSVCQIDRRDIFLLGLWLNVLNSSISQSYFNSIIGKLDSALLATEKDADNGFQLNDVFSEIETLVAFTNSEQGPIKIEEPTGVLGGNGKKNADFYIQDKDVFVEVKAYHFMQSKRYEKFIEESSALFNAHNNDGKAFIFSPQDQWKYTTQKYQSNGMATAVQVPGAASVQSLKNLLRNAAKKFTKNQTAIVVLDRVHAFERQNINAAATEFFQYQPASAIKAIVFKTARNWGLDGEEWKSQILYVSRDQRCTDILHRIIWPGESVCAQIHLLTYENL